MFLKELRSKLTSDKFSNIGQNLSLNQVIPPNLHGSFFYNFIGRALKLLEQLKVLAEDPNFDKEKLMHSLFIIFQVENDSMFAYKINKHLSKFHEQLVVQKEEEKDRNLHLEEEKK